MAKKVAGGDHRSCDRIQLNGEKSKWLARVHFDDVNVATGEWQGRELETHMALFLRTLPGVHRPFRNLPGGFGMNERRAFRWCCRSGFRMETAIDPDDRRLLRTGKVEVTDRLASGHGNTVSELPEPKVLGPEAPVFR